MQVFFFFFGGGCLPGIARFGLISVLLSGVPIQGCSSGTYWLLKTPLSLSLSLSTFNFSFSEPFNTLENSKRATDLICFTAYGSFSAQRINNWLLASCLSDLYYHHFISMFHTDTAQGTIVFVDIQRILLLCWRRSVYLHGLIKIPFSHRRFLQAENPPHKIWLVNHRWPIFLL